MKTVYFVRHGEAQANADGLLAGAATNTPLTPRGIQQAHELAERLRGKQFDLIVSSPLERATETAEIIVTELDLPGEISLNQLFIERDFGSATDMPNEEGFAALDNGTATDVESIPTFSNRARTALQWLQSASADTILVVSHAGFGQMIGTVMSGRDPMKFIEFHKLSNAGWYKLNLDAESGSNEIEIG